ncbi:bifunctional folylpolyglutamate synthase/dihydrofolate synthase [Algicella marina]|uniref:Dihydrofolate synthase/folylpolyglutamate synthase n=2 Tax=Algicella marina TaxID=2683284 RepID=A0A6P1T724_9RHOB|nr:bifunctional folylpolyglutamate synthase/dihydrofolate synthase [Algicella marina]
MSLHPKVIDLSLDRMHAILAALGDPQHRLPPVVHVAGTNGKGSTQAMIRAGLEGAGHAVHAYTSPHLARFHERIRVAGNLIAEDDLAAILAECEVANGDEPITYFEITTAAALLAFARSPADFTLLEVGLGGRLDATNVMRPALSVITPVSIDHQQFLGETLEEIAFEKAGIIKPGVPCVVTAQEPDAMDVITRQGARMGAPLLIQNQDWQVWEERGRLVYQDEHGLEDLPMPRLIGAHQVTNAGAALAALRHLRTGDLEAAMTDAHWPARLQRLKSGPLTDAAGPGAEVWLDGGHNAAAGEALAEALTRLPARPLYMICGMLKTKDVRTYLKPFRDVTRELHAISIPGEAATLTAAETEAAASSIGIPARQADSPLDAVRQIAAHHPDARILVCGSLYLAGAVLRENA